MWRPKASPADYLDEWNDAIGKECPSRPPVVSGKQKLLHRRLINEEEREVAAELMKKVDRVRLAKELADLVYVTYDTARTYSIPLDKVITAVHESNMTKLNGGVKRRESDGKILKGPFYREPGIMIEKLIQEFDDAR
jgi:predicted HAD superfamily Cof-like phosphohydrolase